MLFSYGNPSPRNTIGSTTVTALGFLLFCGATMKSYYQMDITHSPPQTILETSFTGGSLLIIVTSPYRKLRQPDSQRII